MNRNYAGVSNKLPLSPASMDGTWMPAYTVGYTEMRKHLFLLGLYMTEQPCAYEYLRCSNNSCFNCSNLLQTKQFKHKQNRSCCWTPCGAASLARTLDAASGTEFSGRIFSRNFSVVRAVLHVFPRARSRGADVKAS